MVIPITGCCCCDPCECCTSVPSQLTITLADISGSGFLCPPDCSSFNGTWTLDTISDQCWEVLAYNDDCTYADPSTDFYIKVCCQSSVVDICGRRGFYLSFYYVNATVGTVTMAYYYCTNFDCNGSNTFTLCYDNSNCVSGGVSKWPATVTVDPV